MKANQYLSYPSPAYIYHLDILNATLNSAQQEAKAFGFQIHYALKANYQTSILDAMVARGFGADCVSGNEVRKALENQFQPSSILLAGVGKTDAEITLALSSGIGCLNCESVEELEVIQQIAANLNIEAPVALRVNPEVDARTHAYITTGLSINKFGIQQADVQRALDLIKDSTHLRFRGFHFHVGSQITDMKVFEELAIRVNGINDMAFEQGFRPDMIDVGGGLGIDYAQPLSNPIPDFKAYFSTFHQFLQVREGQRVHFELGRSLVGQCASLLTKVLYVKHSGHKRFVIVDAGMTDLMRPALYQAEHAIENISNPSNTLQPYDVVGPICETSDQFGKDILLPETQRGDLLLIHSVGAYGEVLASNYNLRNRAEAIFRE